MNKKEIESLSRYIAAQLTEGMLPWTGEDSYYPDWVVSVASTVIAEVEGHIFTALQEGLQSIEFRKKRKRDEKVKTLEAKVTELQERLRTYEVIDKAFREAKL